MKKNLLLLLITFLSSTTYAGQTPAVATVSRAPIPTQETVASYRHNLSFLLGREVLGNLTGTTIGITSPFFSEKQFALRLTASSLSFDAYDPTKSIYRSHNVNKYLLTFIWATEFTPRLRGYWKFATGIYDSKNKLTDHVAWAGAGGFGVEYLKEIGVSYDFLSVVPFIEVGVEASRNNIATKLAAQPTFGQGANILVGFKIYRD